MRVVALQHSFSGHETFPFRYRPRREDFLNEEEVGKAVLEKQGSDWHTLICNGENSIVRALVEQLAWTEDEMDIVEFTGCFDG
jgi:hypothetical protein